MPRQLSARAHREALDAGAAAPDGVSVDLALLERTAMGDDVAARATWLRYVKEMLKLAGSCCQWPVASFCQTRPKKRRYSFHAGSSR